MAKGGVIVVRRLRKQTHLSIADPTGTLVKNADVTARGDNGSTYTGKIKRVNATRKLAQARIKCTSRGPTRVIDETETGILKVTIIGGPPVEDVPVTYVDDPESCDEPNPIRRRRPRPKPKKKAK